MVLDEECRKILDESLCIFDLLSSIIECIISKEIDEQDFFEFYFENSAVLSRFEKRVRAQLKYEKCISDYENVKCKIIKAINDTDLEIKEDEERIISSRLMLYAILLAADTAMGNWDISLLKNCGPLDENVKNKYKVYLFPGKPINSRYIDGVNRNRPGRYYLYEELNNLVFLDAENWKKNSENFPKGAIVSADSFKNRRHLKIGVSNFTCSESNVLEKTRESSEFKKYISYVEGQEKFVSYVENSIEKAIENSCDILVFPEYSCSKIIRDEIARILKKHKAKNRKTPIITIAGSTWTDDDSNVSFAYNRRGTEIGRYYKRFKYINSSRTYVEDITNLGKECTFYFAKGLGIILLAICRDAVESGCTDHLVQLFFPTILLIPAYSESINDFKRHLTPFAELQFTSSVVVGYCNKVKKEAVGCCYIPQKDDTKAGSLEGILSKADCNGLTDCMNGCLHVIDMNFNFKAEADHTVVTNTSLRINGKEIKRENSMLNYS